MRTRQEMVENNVSKVANDVNEYIFLLQKYSNAQNQLSDQAKSTIKKYQQEEEGRKIKERQREKAKQLNKEMQKHAICEMEAEFSVAETDNDMASSTTTLYALRSQASLMRSKSQLTSKDPVSENKSNNDN